MFGSHLQNCKVCQTLRLSVKVLSSNLLEIEVVVPAKVVARLEESLVEIYKTYGATDGFIQGGLPESYIRGHFCDQIELDIKKFVYKVFVRDFLHEKSYSQDVPSFYFPRLEEVTKTDAGALVYKFLASHVVDNELFDWRRCLFVPPKRKLYKDLDRQAQTFVNSSSKPEVSRAVWTADDSDWVCFKSKFLGKQSNRGILACHENYYWIKLSKKYLIDPFQSAFFGRKVGEQFQSTNLRIDNSPGDTFSTKGQFQIGIDKIWKGGLFCLDLFKSAFDLFSDDQIHEKLIEIFSFRNDISQRRSIVEEAFRVIFSRVRLEVPRHMVLRHKEHILKGIRRLPDYNVYKSSADFHTQLEALAEKQLREETLIDLIAKKESIVVDENDSLRYLNLLSSERLSEFVYFKPKLENFGGSMLPISECTFSGEVLREKTLNYIIRTVGKGVGSSR